MPGSSENPRYNPRIRQMLARASSGLGTQFPHSLFLTLFRLAALLFGALMLPSSLFASNLGDAARQLADRIAAISGPGAVALEVTNRSSLDEKSVHEVRSALSRSCACRACARQPPSRPWEASILCSRRALRDYVWTAEIATGGDAPRVVLVSLPREHITAPWPRHRQSPSRRASFSRRSRPILDAAILDMPSGSRLLVLDATRVAVYRQQGGHWELETYTTDLSHPRVPPRYTRPPAVAPRSFI